MKLHEMKWGVTDHVVGVRGAKRERGSNDGGRVEKEREREKEGDKAVRARGKERERERPRHR